MDRWKTIIFLTLITVLLGSVLSPAYSEGKRPINARVMRDPAYLLKKDNTWSGTQTFKGIAFFDGTTMTTAAGTGGVSGVSLWADSGATLTGASNFGLTAGAGINLTPSDSAGGTFGLVITSTATAVGASGLTTIQTDDGTEAESAILGDAVGGMFLKGLNGLSTTATGNSVYVTVDGGVSKTVTVPSGVSLRVVGAITVTDSGITNEGKHYLPQQNNAITPTIAFGDMDTGIYESEDDYLRFTIGGIVRFGINQSYFLGSGGIGSPAILRYPGSFDLPSYSFNIDENTGLYRPAADMLSLVAGGVETARTMTTGFFIPKLLFGSDSGATLSGVSVVIVNANTFNADDVRSRVSPLVGWFKVDKDTYPNGIIIDSVYMQIFSNATDYQVDVEEWTSDACPSYDNDIEADLRANTTSEVEVRGTDIDHRVVEGGNWVFINFDDADLVQQTYIKIKGRIR